MSHSVKSIEKDAEPLIGFFQYIGTLLEPESGWQLEIGREIWNTAVDLGLAFTRDPTLTDFRITLSKDALLSRTFATIKDHDLQGLQECLFDGRLDLLEKYRSPWQPRDDDDILDDWEYLSDDSMPSLRTVASDSDDDWFESDSD